MLINNDLMSNILADIFEIFYPCECLSCGHLLPVKSRPLCFACLSELPVTGFCNLPGNPVEIVFKGRLPLVAATSLLYFEKKGIVQQLIHSLKYQGQPEIGIFLGQWLGEEMSASGRFEGIDAVVPVPLHPRKERKRGYNQVHLFARELAKQFNADFVPDLLAKSSHGETQTHKSRFDRVSALSGAYALRPGHRPKGEHLLIVDDIITSGATLESCCRPLMENADVRMSVASMAFTV